MNKYFNNSGSKVIGLCTVLVKLYSTQLLLLIESINYRSFKLLFKRTNRVISDKKNSFVRTISSILVLPFFISCNAINPTDTKTANNNLLYGLMIGMEQVKNSTIDIRGSWEQYMCSSGNCITTGNPYAHLYISTEPGSKKGIFYQENWPTCFTDPQGGQCPGITLDDGERYENFFPADRSIETFSNSKKRLLYKDARANPTTYSYFLWEYSNDETYVCDIFPYSNSESAALVNLNRLLELGTISTKESNLKTDGCNGSGWYLLKKRTGVY